MTEETLKNLVINKVPSQEVYDAMLAAGLIESNELYFVAGGGGNLVVETEYVEGESHNGGTAIGYKTTMSADDIVDAYSSGAHVVFHFPEYNDGTYVQRPNAYVSLYAYNGAYQWGEEAFHHDYQAISWWCGTWRTQDGKLMFQIYVD